VGPFFFAQQLSIQLSFNVLVEAGIDSDYIKNLMESQIVLGFEGTRHSEKGDEECFYEAQRESN